MKYVICLVVIFIGFVSFSNLPKGFVSVKEIIPDLDVELKYFSSNNFIGKPVRGYYSNTLILTKQTAEALKLAQEELQQKNLCLKVYDGYRPQRAVNHFVRWAKNLKDTINKSVFYPTVKKKNLFKLGYIASKSGHSRGSTVDLTIIDGNTGKPLDMGSPYDFFGKESWLDYHAITDQQRENRMLLQSIMLKHGFRNYSKEWWHFTLQHEPFPDTYFDFIIK